MTEFNDLNEIRDGHKESRLEIRAEHDEAKKLSVFHLVGRLDIFTYRELAKQLDAALERCPDLRLVVDFADVNFVASSGWSVFIATRSKLRRGGGSIAFAAMNADLSRVYQAMRMPDLVKVYPSSGDAVGALSAGV
jgi:anti-anti-sigma factor